jgi:Uma2 family endonuclease
VSDVAAHPPNLTWDEFLALPYELHNVALIDGEVVMNPPTAQQELIVRRLSYALTAWLDAAPGRGDVSTQQPVKINDHRGDQPDVSWYRPEACAPPGAPAGFVGPPSLVVEVLSPSTRAFDQLRKRADYQAAGIAELWFIDPDPNAPCVQVCRRPAPGARFDEHELGPDDELASPLLPGFGVAVRALYRR